MFAPIYCRLHSNRGQRSAFTHCATPASHISWRPLKSRTCSMHSPALDPATAHGTDGPGMAIQDTEASPRHSWSVGTRNFPLRNFSAEGPCAPWGDLPCENNACVRTTGRIWRPRFLVHEDQVFLVVWGWGWYFGDADDYPATCLGVQACRSSYIDRTLRSCHCK